MDDVDERLARLGVLVPDVLLPNSQVNLYTWAVVACDQFTSERDYWDRVAETVEQQPSSLQLIFPEVYLADSDSSERIVAINAAMTDYLERGLFDTHVRTILLIRRVTDAGKARWGLIVALDLDHYSSDAAARSLIRATEGTVLDRIPPRVAVRQDAPLELPHIMVLIDDPTRSVIEPLADRIEILQQVYDTDLMLGGGHVSAWAVKESQDLHGFAASLEALRAALDPDDPLLFAMGDGNHSFATAKTLWDSLKTTLSESQRRHHPARFCLVELENVFDPGLTFEAIHRVVFGCARNTFEAELSKHCRAFDRVEQPDLAAVLVAVENSSMQVFGYADADGYSTYQIHEPHSTLAAGTLQRTIDSLTPISGVSVDYTHGVDVTAGLGTLPNNFALFLPTVSKESLFEAIRSDGALPRKTFSMGEASDKRYYLEARRIR